MRERLAAWLPWNTLFFCLVLILGGCSTKLTSVTPLTAPEKNVAEQRFRAFMEQPSPPALDADVRLRWDVLGYDGSIDGMLQIQPPAYLRLTIVDPLGRPLFIIASDGNQYTAIDGQAGKAYTGDTDSSAWKKYIPGQLDPADLFSMLGGRILEEREMIQSVGMVDSQIWYIFGDQLNEKRFRYQLDEAGKTMVAQIMVTKDGKPGIRVDYDGYKKWSNVSKEPFWWPEKLTIQGDLVQGNFDIEFKEIVATSELAPSHFQLTIPSHYQVEVAD